MKRLRILVSMITAIVCIVLLSGTLWAGQATKVKPAVEGHGTIGQPKPPIPPPPNPLPGGTVGTMQPVLLKSDLQVGVISVAPQNPGEGQLVTFTGNVMNYGLGAARNPVVTLFVSGPTGVTFPIFHETFNVTLQKNQGVTFVQKFKVPKHGDYTCKFTLDPIRMIAETNEGNNEKSWTFGVSARPDLIVCISNGKRPPVGRSREIRAVVKNIGNCASNHAAEMKLRFYVEGKGTTYHDIPSLASGSSTVVSHQVTRNHKWGTSGTKTITAEVIYNMAEINPNNNQVSGSYFVRLPHHDTYSAAPKVKCSTNANFNSWEQCDSQH